VKRDEWVVFVCRRAYPRAFRDRFEAGMRDAFAEDLAHARERGRFAAARFIASSAFLALWFGLVERLPKGLAMRSLYSVDLRDAFRSLKSTPVITAVAILSLALGIGANTALFSIINSLMIRTLPVKAPEQLAMVGLGQNEASWTNPIWEQVRARQHELFESAFAWSAEEFDLSSRGRRDMVDGAYASGQMFDVLGVSAAIGRTFGPSDDTRGSASSQVAVITHRFWQQRYAGASDIIGREITVNHVPFTIIGVMPAGFFGPDVGRAADVMLPVASEAAVRGGESSLDNRSNWWLNIMVRLREGQTLENAMAALNAVQPQIREATLPELMNAERRNRYMTEAMTLVPAAQGRSPLRFRYARPLIIIMLVVSAVLLIACANIANVLLARASARRHEMGVRLALGASRARLARQLLIESLLLAIAGAAAGMLFAEWGSALLVRQLATSVDSVFLDMPIDWRVLGFTSAVALATTLLFGLAPAIGVRGVAPNEALRDQTRSVTGDRRFGVRNALIVAQISLSLALAVGAGLFLRTFASMATAPLGFDPGKLLIVNIELDGDLPEALRAATFERLRDAAATTAGVRSVAASHLTPVSGSGWNTEIEVPGNAETPSRQRIVWFNAISSGWFDTYGMQLKAGRRFSSADIRGAEPVVIINEAFAARHFADRNPIGQRIKAPIDGDLPGEYTIVGIVSNTVYRSVRSGVKPPTMYAPLAQTGALGTEFALTARVDGSKGSAAAGIAEVLSRADSRAAFTFRDFSEQVSASMSRERLIAMISGFFGLLAVLLAAIGLYGVTSYSVSRRLPEIAVRMALGANAGGVLRLVMTRVAVLMAVGVAVGIGLSLWAAKFIGTLLFNVESRDPWTIAGAAVVLCVIGAAAAWLPARRASRLDPTSVLRA
jgi:putative ABC transport system permease protein